MPKYQYDKLNFNQGYTNGKRDVMNGLILPVLRDTGLSYAKGYLAGQEAAQKAVSDAIPVTVAKT